MKKYRLLVRTVILLLLATALGYTLYSNFFVEKIKVSVGDVAPDFVITDIDGNRHQLSEYRGNGVIVNFWGTWCKPCEREMPYLENQYNLYKDQGIQMIAINVGEPKFSVESFVDQYEMTFPVGIDKGNELLNLYGVDPLPTTFFIDKDGHVIDIVSRELTERMIHDYIEQIKP
ncbi:thiol-disulfide oxidoreductase ResA [Bacillus sp. PS06]|uniref:thiol-disulfide oxidoreductase ResA n=1 Tax=Bacillus sp. PS06 TaxID=2764176 RepID=UPI001783CB61|nr:thiol-disulfide oxidoreductase ResA [Bacillus sp. PS06]MBD8070304.1 thiol-disulfide oxidoreductase ResA [Bacillus sp. PS06]